MKKIFISSDIEGTCGIAHWDETEPEKGEYAQFQQQMSREVSAACEGCLAGGAERILVRDAHNTARNILPGLLPDTEKLSVFRGWGRDPYAMMSGLEEGGYTGAMFTGYHSAGSWTGSPLSHTMNTENVRVTVNGETASELMINSLTASMLGVPVLMVTGDEMLCDWFHGKVPAAVTVPVSRGVGNGSVSIMPGEAVRRIRAGAERAMGLNAADCMYPTADHYVADITFRRHMNAKGKAWYPGAKRLDDLTVRYESDSWLDVLVFFHFCL